MKNQDFRRWIEAGYRDYGEDPWFFIRELAQNSRDAGARTIHVKAGWTTAGEEIVVFEDDGKGMTYDDAVRYLFRLYASSKAGNKNAAGMFGIGFWTVMRFSPRRVMIESRVGSETWGVWVDEQLRTIPFNSRLSRGGTRITLIRPAQEPTAAVFEKKVKTALEKYCTYLRRANRNADPLPVIFGGENITRDMTLPGPVSFSFRSGGVEGAVGLGTSPKVRLYARGLPVWEGTSLDELSHKPPEHAGRGTGTQDIGRGLAPVFLLNGNHLEVNISRRKVIDNRHLHNVKSSGEKALSRMVEMAADWVVPRSFFRRLGWSVKKIVSSLFRSFTRSLITLMILIIPLEIFVITHLFKPDPGVVASGYVSLEAGDNVYDGASVRVVDESDADDRDGIRLTYTPAEDRWFKLFNADMYRTDSGFAQVIDSLEDPGAGFNPATVPRFDCSPGKRTTISLTVNQPGRIFLPQAEGAFLDPGGLKLNRKLIYPDRYKLGEFAVLTVKTKGELKYRCCQLEQNKPISFKEIERLVQFPPGVTLPPEIDKKLTGVRHLELEQKVGIAVQLTVDYLSYDNSLETAKKYNDSASGNWLEKVLELGVGDCDIINGVTALFLRRMGVPSRLAIGLVGKKGRVLPGLHAWTEYYDEDRKVFRVVDSSAYASTLDNAPGSGEQTEPRRRSPFPNEARPEPGPRVTGSWRFVLFGILIGLVAVMLLLTVKLFGMRRRETGPRKPEHPGDLNRVRENLADMLLHSLLHPGVWGKDSGIRHFQVIPTIYGSAVSLRQAVAMGKQQRLFTLNSGHPLARFLVQAKHSADVPVLDSGSHAFGPLIRLLPGAVHLERVLALKIDRWGKNTPANREADALLASINALLSPLDRQMPLILAAPGLDGDDLFDVDLSLLPSLEAWGMPNRFVAVNPFGPRILKWASLFRDNPQLAQYRLISMVFKQSMLIPRPIDRWKEELSVRLLKEVTPS